MTGETAIMLVEDSAYEPSFSAGDVVVFLGERVAGVMRGKRLGVWDGEAIEPSDYIAAADEAKSYPVLWDHQNGEPAILYEVVPFGSVGAMPKRIEAQPLFEELYDRHRIIYGKAMRAHPWMDAKLRKTLGLKPLSWAVVAPIVAWNLVAAVRDFCTARA